VADPRPPKLPELDLLQPIGSGGYGEVWLCRNALDALRAVKIVRRSEFDDERPYEREFNGIKNFEPISRTHEGFIDILQVGRNNEEGYFYYVMELADNQGPPASPPADYQPRTLASEIKLRGAIPFDEAIKIAFELAGALAELHRHNLVHRDIKPSNIIFINGRPKLADVGLVSSVTAQSRSFVGTEGFLPPEGPGTPQADIYSLGIVLYVLATGKHHRDFPEPPAGLGTRPDRNQLLELTAIIHKATQANPRDRYQSADALLADLQHLAAGRSVKRRHTMVRNVSWAWKAALAISLAGVGWLVIQRQQTQKAPFDLDEISSFDNSGSTNLLAWEAAVRGKTLAKSMMAAGMSNGIVQYEQAVTLDPNFAYAWQMLAGAHILLVDKGFAHGSNHIDRARGCAENAIQLNPNRGLAWQWLAFATLAADYDFSRAEPLFRKAIQIMPNFPGLRHNYAIRLWHYGRADEAKTMLRRVLRDDPSLAYSHSVLGQIAASRGDYPDALRELSQCILLAPTGPDPHIERFEILWLMNRKSEALNDLWRCMELDGFSVPDRESSLGFRNRSNTESPSQTLSAVVQLLEKRRTDGQFVSSFDLARFHALLGNKTVALDWLGRAVEEHRPKILSAKVLPAFAELRDEPRFQAILRRLRLEN
jgi:serine/threonine protein kinase/Flp pilus assembly protein TadD